MNETELMRAIQLDCSNGATRLWRMQVGNFELMDGRRIQVGISGMSDLLGISEHGRFVAIEVKVPGARTDAERLKAQQMFIETVIRLGGLGGFAESVSDARRILAGEYVESRQHT